MSEPDDLCGRGLAERLRPLVGDRPLGERLFIAALLESGSAVRYREWAAHAGEERLARELEQCACREDAIAAGVHAEFARIITKPADLPDLLTLIQREVAALSDGRSADEQFRIQAAAERAGAAFWIGIAAEDLGPDTRRALLDCARLEAESAAFLESLAQR